MTPSFSHWLNDLFQAAEAKGKTKLKPRTRRLACEQLEDRVVPATLISIVTGAAGTGTLDAFLSATDGTINATDSAGIAGSISQGALQTVGAGIQISITAETSITFAAGLTTPIALQTNNTSSAQFIALNGGITFADTTDTLTTSGGGLALISTNGALNTGNLASANGGIDLFADTVNIVGTVNAGNTAAGGVVRIRQITDGTDIDLGTETVGDLSLTQAELNQVTARVLRIGTSNSGQLTISTAITLGANVPTLSLFSGDTGTNPLVGSATGAITQTGALSVANLAVSSVGGVQLTNAGNDVGTIASSVTGGVFVNNNFRFVDTNGLVVGTVDGVAGITVAGINFLEVTTGSTLGLTNGLTASSIGLSGGGAVTQGSGIGAAITASNLEMIGTGPYTLDNVNNSTNQIAALVTNAVTYTNAGSLTITGFNFIDGFGGLIVGITTTNAPISVNTVNGFLTVNSAVNSGSGTLSLTAGDPNGVDPDLTINAAVTGTGGVTLVGDNININAAVNAGANVAFIRQFANGTLINLGGADGTNTLGLTAAEINNVTAGVIVVGNATAGNIGVSTQIMPTGTSQLELVTGGSIIDNNITNPDITVTRLGLTAGTGVGLGGTETAPLDIAVSNVEATTATGGIFLANTGSALTIGGVNGTLTGVRTTTSGDINLFNNDAITVGTALVEGVSTAGGGNISLFTVIGNINVTATSSGVAATGGNGNVTINAEDDVNIAAAISAVGTGDITITAEPGGGFGTLTTFGNGTITAASGDIALNAADDVNVGAAVAVTAGTGTIVIEADTNSDTIGIFSSNAGGTLTTAGGDVSIRATDVDLGATINVTTAAGSEVFLRPRSDAAIINLGTDVGFGLTDADLDFITANTVHIGAATHSGGIAVTGQVSLAPALVLTLSLETTGAITDATAGEQTDITVTSLALRAATGIGSAADLDLAVTNLATSNSTSGNTLIFNTGALTLARNIDGLSGITNIGGGNIAITTGSPLIIDSAVLDAGGGNIVLSTTGANGDITKTVNGTVATTGGNGSIALDSSAATSGGTIIIVSNVDDFDIDASGSGAVNLFAAGAITVAAGVVIQSDTGLVTLESNSNNAGIANINRTGNITLGANVTVQTDGAIVLDADPDGNCIGGAILMTPTTRLIGTSVAAANSIFLRAGNDVTLSTLTAVTSITVISCQNIVDDGDDTTFLSANTITLDSDGRIGGQNIIQVDDVLSAATTPTLIFREAIDFDFTGANPNLTIIQSPAGGNVQLRKVNSGLTVNAGTLNIAAAVVGPVNQFALISSGGNLNLNTLLAPPTNLDTLLATTGGFDIVFGAAGQLVNGTATATTTVVASGSTAADISGPANDNNPQISGSTIRLHTTGGNIGTAVASLEINANRLDGFTNGNAATGGNAFITDVANGVAIGQFNAGTGNFTLHSIGNTGISTNITAVTANDGIAEVIGNVVTLDVTNPATATTAPTTGNIGQIGSFSGTAQFFEVDANVLNAATNNSRLWISEVGSGASAGTSIGLVNAGTNTAFLRVRNGGNFTSQTVDGTADVVAATVNLSAPEAGNFGTSTAAPLEIDATTLIATVTGAGNIFVRDQATGLTVQTASTTGNVGIETVGGGLVLGNANSTVSVVTATGGTATLTSTAAITSGAPGVVPDVTASSLAATANGGGIALDTVVSTFAASAAGDILLSNTGDFTIGTVNTVVGVTAVAGTVGIATTGSLIVANNVAGDLVGLTTTDAATAGQDLTVNAGVNITASGAFLSLRAGDNLTVNGTVTTTGFGTTFFLVDSGNADAAGGVFTIGATGVIASAQQVIIDGDTDADTFNIRPQVGASLLIDGLNPTAAPGDVLNVDLTGTTDATLTPTVPRSGGFTFTNRGAVDFTDIENLVPLNGVVDLVLDLFALGFQDGSAAADIVNLSTTPGGVLNATIQSNGAGPLLSYYSGLSSAVGSVTVIGSSDAETFRIDETNPGLPPIDVDGNAPIAAPGDRLEINFTNATGTVFAGGVPGSGTYTFGNRAAITYSDIETPPASLITIVATDATAAEVAPFQAPDSGLFTLTRVGDLSVALTVSYRIEGTAANGIDYDALAGSVTFLAGSSTATIVLTARNDSQVEGTQFVTLVLTPGTGYTFQPGTAATVNIVDNDRITTGYVASSGNGTLADIRVYGPADPQNPRLQFTPFGNYLGGVVVATGDVNGDGIADIGVAVSSGGNPHVKVFNGIDGSELASFFAFDLGYLGGVTLAIADLNGDGLAEIIVGAAEGVSHVKVFSGNGLSELLSFFAYTDANGAPTPSGVNVSAGDFNGDGRSEIVTGARSIAPHVKVFNGFGAEVNSFIASFAGIPYNGGVTVTAGDLDGDGLADLAAGITVNGQSLVNVYSSNGGVRGPIAIPNPRGVLPGISISDFNGNGNRELLITSGPQVNFFDGVSLGFIGAIQPYANYAGDIFVGA